MLQGILGRESEVVSDLDPCFGNPMSELCDLLVRQAVDDDALELSRTTTEQPPITTKNTITTTITIDRGISSPVPPAHRSASTSLSGPDSGWRTRTQKGAR
ncbi:hypothetical protein E4U35_000215 [Claviceps purpurea]|nr:hypothetical protein E4U35_000215 [Claviceps purpurea]